MREQPLTVEVSPSLPLPVTPCRSAGLNTARVRKRQQTRERLVPLNVSVRELSAGLAVAGRRPERVALDMIVPVRTRSAFNSSRVTRISADASTREFSFARRNAVRRTAQNIRCLALTRRDLQLGVESGG